MMITIHTVVLVEVREHISIAEVEAVVLALVVVLVPVLVRQPAFVPAVLPVREPVPAPARQRCICRKAAASGSGEEVKASLPGNVLRIETSEGASVAEGDVLLVLEAMKMEIEVKAPKAGTVQSVLVAQGDKVVNGTPLVTIG